MSASVKEGQELVGHEELSKLTGFPIEFIKSELMLTNENISVENLRGKVLDYLNHTNNSMND